MRSKGRGNHPGLLAYLPFAVPPGVPLEALDGRVVLGVVGCAGVVVVPIPEAFVPLAL